MAARDLPAELSGKMPKSRLRLPGTSGNYASCPRTAALGAMTGDIDVRWFGYLDDWTPASYNVLVGRYNTTSNQRCWMMVIENSGAKPGIYWSNDGTTIHSLTSTVEIPGISNGDIKGIRVTLDVDNGSGGRTVRFYASSDLGETWDLLDTNAGGSVTSVYDSATSVLEVGARNSGTALLTTGGCLSAEVRDGIDGTIVASPNFTAPMEPRQRDAQGNIWTLSGSSYSWEKA